MEQQHPPAVLQLPQVVYSIVDRSALIPADVDDKLAISFGFNAGIEWEYGREEPEVTDRDGRYIRWLQPMESALSSQVEYDMDEQDQAWLDAVNLERKKDGNSPISPETFEIIFDKLEKEWFDLNKSIPKKASALPSEDSRCAICDDGECENSNAIVFCDGCNLAVHQDCYGVPYIPEGQWLCRKCTVSPDKPVSCVLCPNSYGAFKQTTTSQWAHLLCAIWVPDTGVSNTVYMEPIDGVENIPRSRWKLVCFLCRKKAGACIQCANKNCFTAFHVTCGRERGLELRMKSGTTGEMKAFCDKHSRNFTPSDSFLSAMKQPRSKKSSLVIKLSNQSKSARAYKQTYSTGPPIIPAYIFNRLMEYIARIKIGKKASFLSTVCRYWSLKREARRGAPLLKRLHLEPWTATASSRHQTDNERVKKLELIQHLRKDLEKVRMLTERVGKREKKKLERVLLFKRVIDDFIFSKDKLMLAALRSIILLDKNRIFAQPVSRIQAPDYYDIIKYPMDWTTMSDKLDRHEYLSATDFQDDVELVLNNARRYNKSDTIVHKSAIKVGEAAQLILAELDGLDRTDSVEHLRSLELLEALTEEVIEDLFEYNLPDPNAVDEQHSPEPAAPLSLPLFYSSPLKTVKSGSASKLSKSAKSKNGKRKRNSDVAHLDRSSTAASTSQGAIDPSPSFLPSDTATNASPKKRKTNVVVAGTQTTPSISAIPTGDASSPRKSANQPNEDRHLIHLTPSASSIPVGVTVAPSSSTPTLVPAPSPVSSLFPHLNAIASSSHLIVPHVDEKASFTLFESGWVLPAGSSRRKATNSVSPTLAVLPLIGPSSQSRKGKERQPIIPDQVGGSTDGALAVDQDVDMADGTKPDAKGMQGNLVVTLGDIEKHINDDDDGGISGISVPLTSPRKGSTKVKKIKKEKRDESRVLLSTALKNWEDRVDELLPSVEVSSQMAAEDGSLVWAKMSGFSPFPAEIADPKDVVGTPQELLKHRPTGPGSSLFVLVLFFSPHRTGAWIARNDLRQLGENDEFDRLMQSPIAILKYCSNKSKKHGKTNSMVARITVAYKTAIATMPDEDDLRAEALLLSSSNKKKKKKKASKKLVDLTRE